MADYDIFISYRRVGGADFARQMQLALKNKGYSVFLAFDELKDGVFEAQRKISGDKRKSWPNEIKNTFHQRLLLEML